MKRAWMVGCLLLMGLGCTGLVESAVELSTGGSMDIAENGDVTMTLPDGLKVETKNGAPAPDGFPLPPPWEGAVPQSVVFTSKDEAPMSVVVSYGMERPREELSAFYTAWLTENGSIDRSDKEGGMGVVVETLAGKLDDGSAAVITLTEAPGANSVSVIWAPGGVEALNPR